MSSQTQGICHVRFGFLLFIWMCFYPRTLLSTFFILSSCKSQLLVLQSHSRSDSLISRKANGFQLLSSTNRARAIGHLFMLIFLPSSCPHPPVLRNCFTGEGRAFWREFLPMSLQIIVNLSDQIVFYQPRISLIINNHHSKWTQEMGVEKGNRRKKKHCLLLLLITSPYPKII